MESKEKIMCDAIALANWFIEKSLEDKNAPKLDLLRLIKLVYIAYGFGLALLDRCLINERFDKVEAWKLGPVIPSVYHTFKHHKDNTITTKAEILEWDSIHPDCFDFIMPTIDTEDKLLLQVLNFVWERYKQFKNREIIDMLHQEGTPWKYCYSEGKNVEIPKEMTKLYYSNLVDLLIHGNK
ncbi:MAG: DUF4065 domain-containing protein [Bacteroides sp.]|nr:DUF4065 domain-containing protein [Bacteroides sp.]